MAQNTLQDAVATALNMENPAEIVETIKAAVIREFESLDPTVEIKTTDYFNHSYAPDLVLRWGNKDDREVYLRYNLKSTQAANDVDLLGRTGPVFFSLDSSHDDDEAAGTLADEIRDSPALLVTNAPAIDGFVTSGARDAGSVATPLVSLFRRNVVRGGRGLLVSDTASRVHHAPPSGDLESELGYINSFRQTVDQIFGPAAALRLRRAANMVQIARTGETSLFDQGEDEQTPGSMDLPQGKLETDELRVLLPYLLSQAWMINDTRFWRYVGSLMTLSQLEEIAGQLSDLDLAALVKANLDAWHAARSIVSFNADSIDESEEPNTESLARWTIHAKMLSAVAGAWQVHFTTDKRRGRSRDDSPLARWEDLRQHLGDVSVAAIDLVGVARQVKLSADDESNLLADVDSIQGTIADEFKVRSMIVRSIAEEPAEITLDFKTLTAEGANVSVRELAEVSFGILGQRYPISEDQRQALFDPDVPNAAPF